MQSLSYYRLIRTSNNQSVNLRKLSSLRSRASGLLPDGSVMRRWIIPGVVCGSCLGIGLSRPAISDSYQPIGRTLNGTPAQSASSMRELSGALLKSGLRARRKEDESYGLLLEKRALIQIKLVNGELAAVVLPDTECPAR